MRLSSYTLVFLTSLFVCIFISACSSKNPNINFAYDPQKDYSFIATAEDSGVFENPPTNKARIYAFRESKFKGSAVGYNITLHSKAQADNGFKSGNFFGYSRSGGAFMVDIIPSGEEIYLSAKTEARVSFAFTPQPNRIYCVASGFGMGIIIGRPAFTFVEKSVCKDYISQYFKADSMQQWQQDKEKFEKKNAK